MKTGWERSNGELRPELSTIQRLLGTFLDGDIVTSYEWMSGGLNHSHFKMTTSSREVFVLRIYQSDHETMEKEKQLLQLLKGSVPVPDVYDYGSSDCVLGHPYILLSMIDGGQLSEGMVGKHDGEILDIIREVGKILAHIHRIEFPGSGLLNESLHIKERVVLNGERFLSFIEESLSDGFGHLHIKEELCARVLMFARTHAHLMDDLSKQTSLVHGDFNPLNILVKGSSVVGIIDWGYSLSGSGLMDIGNLLRYEDVRNPQILGPFIYSYRKHGGHLPDQWLEKAKLIDLIALCDLLNRKECGETRRRDLVRLMEKTMEDWPLLKEKQT